MPLTSKGEEIKKALTKEYGAKKGEQVLYAGKNKGTFTGIDADVAELKRCIDAAYDPGGISASQEIAEEHMAKHPPDVWLLKDLVLR
jgi:hypothetical protein